MADTQHEVATKSVEVAKQTISRERKHKFVFKKCCCCVPLRTGSLILAYLFLVGSIMSGMYSILALTSLINGMLQYPEISHLLITFLVLSSVNLGLALFAIAFNVVLLIGLHKEKRSFVRLFVRFQFAYTILFEIQFIVVIAISYANAVNMVAGLASLVFNIYCTLVMRSQYLKMGATVSSEPVGRYKDGHVVITP